MIEKIRESFFYKQFIRPGDLCFDIGANIGDKTKIFLELGARVIAVEPQIHCVETMKKLYAQHPHFILVENALGAKEGTTEMYINDSHVLSTLSHEWIEKMNESKRFGNLQWNNKTTILLTTLDHLISKYGMPKFCKIDVEGYEHKVLQGLSRPLPALSFEFASEYIEGTIRCIEHLNHLGKYVFNYCVNTNKKMVLPYYVESGIFSLILQNSKQYMWGDVYARLIK